MRGYVPLISTLAAIWGASYLFIKVAVDEIEPIPMMGLRLLLGTSFLLPFLLRRLGTRRALHELRANAGHGLVLGVINAALPFTLIAWGEKHIDSGVAAIANATVPIFVVLLAIRFQHSERVTGVRLAGIALGLVGVSVLAGIQPEGGWWAVAGTLAVVLASLSYACGAIYGQRLVSQTAGPVIATASVIGGATVLLPLSVLQLPRDVPSLGALAAIVALGLLGVGVAQLLLYRMLRLYGSARTSLVTFLMPPIALLYGVVLLGEPLTAAELGGLCLILLGVALGAGALGLVRRATAAA